MISRSLLAPARVVGQSVLRAQSDDRLVSLAKAGSEPAFEAIVARYSGALLGYCRRFLGDEQAEDAVQETFVKAYEALTGEEVVANLRPWLYRIAHNTALNVLRERAMRREGQNGVLEAVENPDRVAERRALLREVLAAVQMLPDRQRDAIVLRELEGRSYEEIAGELGVTGAAVRQLLNRARNSLRAGMTVATPVGLLLRLPAPLRDTPVAERLAELGGAGGAGAVAAKVCVTALVTGAVAGGVATLPSNDGIAPGRAEAQAPSVARAPTPSKAAMRPGPSGPLATGALTGGAGRTSAPARARSARSGPARRNTSRRGDGETRALSRGAGPDAGGRFEPAAGEHTSSRAGADLATRSAEPVSQGPAPAGGGLPAVGDGPGGAGPVAGPSH